GLSRCFFAALYTAEKRRASRKMRRKRADSTRMRRNSHHFSTINAQQTIEKIARMDRTTLAMGPALRTSSATPPFRFAFPGTRDSFVGGESWRSALFDDTERSKRGQQIRPQNACFV